MYIRWVVRKHKNDQVANASFHDAYLVESYRDEQGNPRQRTICYLGNIRQTGEYFPTIERELFLLRAQRILLSVGELNAADREQAMGGLRRRVVPLTSDEVIWAFTENLRWYRQWWEDHGKPMSDDEIAAIVKATFERGGPI